MARRGRSRDTAPSADTSVIASPDLDGLLEPLPALPVDPVSSLDNFVGPTLPMDGRAFSFNMESSHVSTSRAQIPSLQDRVGAVPDDRLQIAVCVRRSQRREVMFAKRYHKRGRGGGRRRNQRSNIRC